MPLPVSFDDTAYFRKEYRGDLIITHGVIYYFPHTNMALEKTKRHAPPDAVDVLTAFMGAAGESIALGRTLHGGIGGLWRTLRGPTINRPHLKRSGLWVVGASSDEMQSLLDKYIASTKREPSRLVGYEYTLPKPLRFTTQEVSNMSLRLGVLRFKTEFDDHDFTVGVRRARRLRETLREGAFLN
jgi:hypothetical protein